MTALERTRRQMLLREAEGYLELLLAFGEQLTATAEHRDQLAIRGLSVLDQLPETHRAGSHAREIRGMLLRAMTRYAEAIPHLEFASEMQEENLHLILALGWCFKRVDQLDQAIEALESGLAKHAQEAILHYNLSCYLSLQHNKSAALKHLGIAFELDTNYRDLVHQEHDFDPIRDDPEFRALTSVLV